MILSMPFDQMTRVLDALDALPPSFQNPRTRVDLFEAARAAYERDGLDVRLRTWERVRYLQGFCGGVGTPFFQMMERPEDRDDPYVTQTAPTFGAILAALNNAAGAFA